MGDFREHGLMLYLGKDAYLGFIKLQADKGLGRSFAGQLAFIEGLFRLGYFNKEAYERLTERYSEALVDEPRQLTKEELQAKTQLQQLEGQFSEVKSQWEKISKKSQDFWLKKARAHPEVANSRLVISKANGSDET